MPKNPKQTPLETMHAPWDNNENVIWLASTVRLFRNIEKFKFCHKLELDQKKHILKVASKAALQSPDLNNPFLLHTEKMTPKEKEFLIEHFLLFEGFQEANQGSACLLDKTGETIVLFNLTEHLQIQCTDSHADLEKSWLKACSIENSIAKEINFSFSPKFGYLTSNPFRCGTGLFVSAYLHLPALIQQNALQEHLENEQGEGIVTSGLQGSPDELVGDILMFRNTYTLGLNEESILSTLQNAVLRLVVAEKEARTKIKDENNLHFKDLISRAIGLVKSSYELEAPEALNALSLLKLGIELGWIKGMKVKDINKLFFETRRSHLSYLLHEESTKGEIASKRADFLRDKTSKLTLK